jgi:hypothetical protein
MSRSISTHLAFTDTLMAYMHLRGLYPKAPARMVKAYLSHPGIETFPQFACGEIRGHSWNMDAAEADENNISGEGAQVIRCTFCGLNGDA